MLHENEIPIGKAKDLRGQKFGRLIPLYRVKSNSNRSKWHCQCDCGKELDVFTTSLTSNHTQSCGCYKTDLIVKDLTGKRFGNLNVIKPVSKTTKTGEYVSWQCRCDCGKECIVKSKSLIQGNTTSCGCKTFQNLEGKTFGLLTVLYATEQRSTNRHIIWHCKCECGNEVDVSAQNLINGGTKTCGCLKTSYGENKISNLLESHGLSYEREKTFDDCRFPDTNHLARFDFYVDNKYLIEFDGKQHFERVDHWQTQEDFEKAKERDEFKNKWCKNHNIKLIRIPYTEIENITINDLII